MRHIDFRGSGLVSGLFYRATPGLSLYFGTSNYTPIIYKMPATSPETGHTTDVDHSQEKHFSILWFVEEARTESAREGYMVEKAGGRGGGQGGAKRSGLGGKGSSVGKGGRGGKGGRAGVVATDKRKTTVDKRKQGADVYEIDDNEPTDRQKRDELRRFAGVVCRCPARVMCVCASTVCLCDACACVHVRVSVSVHLC